MLSKTTDLENNIPPPISNAETSDEYDSLKSQLELIFSDFDKEDRGRIVSRDLLSMIELFEKNQTTCLLKDDARQILQLFCEQNPNMEVSVDDVLQLIASLTPSVPSNCELSTRGSITKLGILRSAPMLSAPDVDNDESFLPSSRSRRLSPFHKTYHDGISDDFSETSFEASGRIDQSISNLSQTIDDPAQQLSKLYRHTVDLTKRLKDSERHLASVARQHEDRIEELQHKLDETKADLQSKKREIQDHKSKEKISSHQISALEGEIQKIQKNLSDQKQLYSQLKKQYEDQCEEAEKLRNLIKLKEEELSKKVKDLNFLALEERKWNEERERLEKALTRLEKDAASSQDSEIELEQQRLENLHLKETIDKLKLDLDEIRSGRINNINRGEILDLNDIGTSKDLRAEMIDHALASIDEVASDSNTEDIRNDKKHRPRRRKDDVSDINAVDEHAQSRSSNDSNRHRVTDIEQPGRKQSGSRSSRRFADQSVVARNTPRVETQFQTLSSELGAQYALIEGILRNSVSTGNSHGNIHDKRDRTIRNGVDTRNTMRRKRRVNSSQEIEGQVSEKNDTQQSKALVPRNANNSAHNTAIVHNTATFALYTVVIYLFGIITSVFVIDNNQGPAPYSDWMPYDDLREDGWASRLGQMILYWAEILLNDGNMRVPT